MVENSRKEIVETPKGVRGPANAALMRQAKKGNEKMKGKRMKYSEIVKDGLILPKKEKYTMRDVNKVAIQSLFSDGGTISMRQARFIVLASAIYHDTECSRAVTNMPATITLAGTLQRKIMQRKMQIANDRAAKA